MSLLEVFHNSLVKQSLNLLTGTAFGASSFGAPAAATTGFGAAATSQPSSLFGANPMAPAAATGTGLFGAQPGAATSTAFGAPAATGAAFG